MYVIEMQLGEERRTKVGISVDPRRRLRQLQTGAAAPLHIRHTVQCRSEHEARTLERRVHDRYSSVRQSGEWFDMPAKSAIKYLKRFDKKKSPQKDPRDMATLVLAACVGCLLLFVIPIFGAMPQVVLLFVCIALGWVGWHINRIVDREGRG